MIEPGAAEIRAELERILASRCFEQAARSSGFLRFVVEQTLAGQGERLKGYTIAVEVFDRPPDFDAQTDPLVRVEAGRLRRRLIEYYADEGRDNPVRLELPRGSYSVVATYAARNAPLTPAAADILLGPMPAEQPAENEAARNRRRWRRIRSVLVATVILAGLGVIVFQQYEVSRLGSAPPTATTGDGGKPPLVVQAFEDLGQGTALAGLAATLTEELFLLLGRPEVLVVAMEGSNHETSATPAYILNGSIRETDGVARITARLARVDTGTQLWTAAYDEPLAALRSPEGQRRIARRIAVVAEPYGPIFQAELERIGAVAAENLTTQDCVVIYYDYRRVFGAAEHARALDCFQRAAAREPDGAEAWGGLAMLHAEAFAQGFTDERSNPPPLERARDAARHAMDIDGENLHANLALAAVQFFGGGDSRDLAVRVLEAWPENAEAQAYFGSMFILYGDTARGKALVESAIEWTPETPSGYHSSLSLAALREQRYADALASALRIDSPDWALGHLVLAVAGALGGRPDLAARARARALALAPTLETSLPAVLARWRVEPVLAAQIERGFTAAAEGP